MPSAAIVKIKKDPVAYAHPTQPARQATGMKAAAAGGRCAAGAAVRRRELAMLLRAIKVLMRQSP